MLIQVKNVKSLLFYSLKPDSIGLFYRIIYNMLIINICRIHPLKSEEGQLDMDRTFTHLTTKEYASFDAEGNELDEKHREFDIQRSKRLHWINHHVHEKAPSLDTS